MGAFFTNLHLRCEDAERAAAAVEDALTEGAAFVSEPAGGWISVYPEATEEQDLDVLERLAADLSAELSCTCLALLVHDDDLLLLWLYESGSRSDQYDSRPDYWEPVSKRKAAATAGRPDRLAAASTKDVNPGEIAAALDRDGEYLFAQDRAGDLASLLGIPTERGVLGYRYLCLGEGAGELGPLREIPRDPARRTEEEDPEADSSGAHADRLFLHEHEPEVTPDGARTPGTVYPLGFDAEGRLWLRELGSKGGGARLVALDEGGRETLALGEDELSEPSDSDGLGPGAVTVDARLERFVCLRYRSVETPDGSVFSLHALPSGELLGEGGLDYPIEGCLWSPDAARVYFYGPGRIDAFDAEGRPLAHLESPELLPPYTRIASAPDGRLALFGSRPGEPVVTLLDGRRLQPLEEVHLRGLPPSRVCRNLVCLSFLPDGDGCVVGTPGGVALARLPEGEVDTSVEDSMQPEAAARARDRWLEESLAKIPASQRRELEAVYRDMADELGGGMEAFAPGQAILSLAVEPEGRWFAAAGADGAVRFWSLPGGRLLGRLETGAVRPIHLLISPDGRRFALPSDDQAVACWRVPEACR